jgi:hypothetical protein
VFLDEAISCERCHGPAGEHLKPPGAGSIVNPARLAPPARDSVCEQCHLAGITQRILNAGRDFTDFRPGQRLEDVFTVYTRAGAQGFKVISHAEQLSLSACARGNSTMIGLAIRLPRAAASPSRSLLRTSAGGWVSDRRRSRVT